jgi:hypothetical protein
VDVDGGGLVLDERRGGAGGGGYSKMCDAEMAFWGEDRGGGEEDVSGCGDT